MDTPAPKPSDNQPLTPSEKKVETPPVKASKRPHGFIEASPPYGPAKPLSKIAKKKTSNAEESEYPPVCDAESPDPTPPKKPFIMPGLPQSEPEPEVGELGFPRVLDPPLRHLYDQGKG